MCIRDSLVYLERVRAVLQRVFDGHGFGRKLAKLAHRNQSGLELDRDWAAEYEPARLHADHGVDSDIAIGLRHQVYGFAIGAGILQQSRNVVEEDARLREVRDLADLGAQLL